VFTCISGGRATAEVITFDVQFDWYGITTVIIRDLGTALNDEVVIDDISIVLEPAAYLTLLAGLALIMLALWRRRLVADFLQN